jgi:hypothetical protein
MGIHFRDLNPGKQREFLILICCLLIGFALRFYTFDQKSLWIDEIHTFNDSRDDLKTQLKFYKEEPTYLHPPLFFILTHLFYPFTKPERDLRIIPLISGSLCIPIFYFLSRSFSPLIALPCTLSLTFMAYHISLSQDGRVYSLIMFLGIVGLYFFMKYLKTLNNVYLLLNAAFFAILFYTSYSSIPFIALSQILWLYGTNQYVKKPSLASFFMLNTLILLLCIPWIFFIGSNYKDQPLMPPFHTEGTGTFLTILYWILRDWVSHVPLIIASVVLLILFPFFSKAKKNAFILLSVSFLPIVGLYLFCKLLAISHFVTSRYFINFLPLFFITLYLSLDSVEAKFERLRRFMRLKIFFVILFIASNLVILPFYYRSEKQDFRGLVTYLKAHLREGDKILDWELGYIPGLLHYFGVYPEDRHYRIPFRRVSETEIELRKSFVYQNRIFTIYYSKDCCAQYASDGSRLWMVVGKEKAKKMKQDRHFTLKGYFDGSFLNFNKFPYDASMYLFLFDPQSQDEKGIDIPIE